MRAKNVQVGSTRRFLEVFFGRFDAQDAKLSMRKPIPGLLGLSLWQATGVPEFRRLVGRIIVVPAKRRAEEPCQLPGYLGTWQPAANLDNAALQNASPAGTVYKCQTSQVMEMALLIGFKHRLESL